MKSDSEEIFVYIDPGFLDNVGHYRSFTRSFRKETVRTKMDLLHLVSDDISDVVANEFSLERKFDYKAILQDVYEQGDNGDNASHNNWKIILSFESKLRDILNDLVRNESQYNKIHIFMYTSHPLYFPVFARLLNQEQFKHLPIKAHLCLFYLNLQLCRKEPSPHYESLLRNVSDLLEWSDRANKINLYADSERTMHIYGKYFKRNIYLIPVPLPQVTQQQVSDKKAGTITIGWFGYTHRKQGYHLVKQLYDQMTRMKKYTHVDFLVRHNIHWLTDETKRILDEFLASRKRIKHYTNYLTSEEYEQLLSSVDIILIPHCRNEYPCQTSGVFIDALKNGAIVVVPEDTWMADQLQKYGSGKTFQSDNIESLQSAVLEVIDNFESYKKNTGRNIEEFRKFHSAERLFSIITQDKTTAKHAVIQTKNRTVIAAASQKVDTDLARFKDKHKWQRCFIVGNGPSLNQMDLNKLENEFVFATNAFFLMFPRIKWRPQYYTAVDTRVVPDRATDIIKMHEENPEMVCFFPKEIIDHQTKVKTPTDQLIPPAPNRLYFNQRVPLNDNLPFSAFSLEPASYLVQPYTVSITVLQLAYLLGFEPIYLIGCDTNYIVPKTVRQEGEETERGKMFFTSTVDDDPNHFSPEYFGKGRKWHNPQVDNMIWHYTMAHEALSVAARHVYNATLGGKLEVFLRVNFDDLF